MKTGIGRCGIGALGAAALGCGLALGSGEAAAQMKYDGVEATVMTFSGPQIAEPLQRRAPDFKKLTGANDQRRSPCRFPISTTSC